MRRLTAMLTALALLATIPAAVSAARPLRSTDHAGTLFCDGIAPTSGTGFLYLGVVLSELFGPDGNLELWTSDAPSGPPDYIRDFEQPIDVTGTLDAFTISFPVIEFGGDPAGDAVISGTSTPVGDTFSFEDDFRFGNRWVRSDITVQPLAAEGTIEVAGLTFSLADCFADDSIITTFETNPTAFTERFATADSRCDIDNGDGTTGSVFIDASSDDVFVDAFLFEGPGTPIGAFGSVTLTDGSGAGSLELWDPDTGEPVPGSASIQLTLTQGDSYSFVVRRGTSKELVRGQLIDVEGTLTFPGLAPFDLTECVAFTGTSKFIATSPRGPKPGGKVPANDLPGGAKLLSVGSKTIQQTRGASPDAEASYSCLTFEEENGETFEIPVANTVWFKIRGTGSPITVDTKGSDFDTVAAVYVSDGAGGFTDVACVDDVPLHPIGFSFQSAVTFDTTVGTTYYIQIGGFPDLQPYGNLRVTVR